TAMPTTSALADIEHALTRVVRIASLPRLHDRLAAAAGVQLDRTSYPVLGRLGEEGPLRLTELASILRLDASTVSRQVHDLAERGMVARHRDPDDGRAGLLSVTEEGRATVERLRSVRRDLLDQIFTDWSHKD